MKWSLMGVLKNGFRSPVAKDQARLGATPKTAFSLGRRIDNIPQPESAASAKSFTTGSLAPFFNTSVIRLAWRLLFCSKQRFVTFLSGVTLVSITLGVFCLIIVLSVMRGFQQELNHRWVGLNAHLTLSGLALEEGSTHLLLQTIQDWPEVQSIQKYLSGEVIVASGSEGEKISVAAKLKGFDHLSGDFLDRMQVYPPFRGDWSLLGGNELLATLNVHPDFSEPLTLVYPFGEVGPSGDFVPTQEKISLSHVFKTGLYLWDAYTILIPLEPARRLLGESAESGIQIRLTDLKFLSRIEKKLSAIVPKGVQVTSFAEQNSRLFAALKLERFAMTFLLGLFLLIASFSIGGLLLMFLSSKQRDLAILRAIGLSPLQAKQLYLTFGGFIGGLGGLFGMMFGGVVAWVLTRYPVELPPTYYLEFLPVKLEVGPWLGIFLLSLALALVSAWYPARLASRLPLLPLLREE